MLLNRGPGAHSTGCWFSLPHLIFNCLNFLCTELYNNLTSTLLPVGVTNRTHSTRPRSRLNPDIPRPDASVIYTGPFPILTAWPGSVCYRNRIQFYWITNKYSILKPPCKKWWVLQYLRHNMQRSKSPPRKKCDLGMTKFHHMVRLRRTKYG